MFPFTIYFLMTMTILGVSLYHLFLDDHDHVGCFPLPFISWWPWPCLVFPFTIYFLMNMTMLDVSLYHLFLDDHDHVGCFPLPFISWWPWPCLVFTFTIYFLMTMTQLGVTLHLQFIGGQNLRAPDDHNPAGCNPLSGVYRRPEPQSSWRPWPSWV